MKRYLGKNVLFTVNVPSLDGIVQEGKVQKLSPGETCVRIGSKWYRTETVGVLEELCAEKETKEEVTGEASKSPTAPATTEPPKA